MQRLLRTSFALLLPALLLTGTLPLPPAAAAFSATPGAATPGTATPDTTDLPPSRAGDAEAAADYEQALSGLLAEVVTEAGNVRYDLLRGRLNADFRRVLKAVESYDARRLSSQSEKMAFWINAYNVQMLANVLEAWPVEDVSAHDKEFFNQPLRTAGMALSLDQIEHAILRKKETPERLRPLQPDTLDPRLHAAVNCAAQSCPRLRPKAFTPQTVDAMLERAMRDFAGSKKHFRRNEGGGFTLNSILKWYGTDFDQTGPPAGDYLLSFMPEDRPHRAALRQLLEGRTAAQLQEQRGVSFAYDWALNAAAEGTSPGSEQ